MATLIDTPKERIGEKHAAFGSAKLYVDVDDAVVAEGELRTRPGHFAPCGEGLTVGRDASDPVPVSKEYAGGFVFTGGRILEVQVHVGEDAYLDLEREFAAAMARD